MGETNRDLQDITRVLSCTHVCDLKQNGNPKEFKIICRECGLIYEVEILKAYI